MVYKGGIILKRKEVTHNASFCIVHKNFKQLSEKVKELHPKELAYYNTLKFEKRKKSYLLGRLTAKEAVAHLSKQVEDIKNVYIAFGVFQFPVVKNVNQNIQVSISHCEDYGVSLAFQEEHPLAIDIEKVDESKLSTMKSIITSGEEKLATSAFSSLSHGITMIWTIKEALSKIIKTGFTADLEIFEIATIVKEGAVYISTFKHFSQYKAISYSVSDHVCSVVTPKNTEVNCNDLWNTFKRIKS